MKLHIAGLMVLSGAALAAFKQTATDHGVEIVHTAASNVEQLWDEAKAKFPDLVTDIDKGIVDLKDATMSGGDKAVKVATDVAGGVADVLKDLPDLKAFLVHGVTERFAVMAKSELGSLEAAAGALLGKL